MELIEHVAKSGDFWADVEAQVGGLIDCEPDRVANLSNVAALLYWALHDAGRRINWCGFYLVGRRHRRRRSTSAPVDGEEDAASSELVLGPFQGRIACLRIARGRGVCGTAWAENRPVLVPDVHAFPGHIACDSASRSEVVLPIRVGGDARASVCGVLDLDSPEPGHFGPDDLAAMERIAEILGRVLYPAAADECASEKERLPRSG